MSGGFFRGTSADQDTRFSNKQAKLMKSQKFPPELEHLVDMTKVSMDVMRPWVANRVTELLGFEDEVLINFIYGLLDGKVVNGKEVQIQLTGFMEKNTGKFMKELWTLLLSAQKNASGVPQQFLDAKQEETRKRKEEADRLTNEIQRKKDKESKELEEERLKNMDGGLETKASTYLEPNSKHTLSKASSDRSEDDKMTDKRNGMSSRNGRSLLTRSISKSRSNSRSDSSERHRSRSLSRSLKARKRSISSERVYYSPRRRSITPHRRRSPQVSLSPKRGRLRSLSQSPSPRQRRSPSPARRRRSPSPSRRRRSPSPFRRRRSPSPFRRRRSPSPFRRRRSPSPVRRRRSPSPVRRRRSPSPVRRRRPPSPVRRRRSPSPTRRRISPLPVRHRLSRSPARRYISPPPMLRRRSPSPLRHHKLLSPVQRYRSPSPVRRYRSPSPVQRASRSPVRGRSLSSPSPVRRRLPSLEHRLQRSPSTPQHGYASRVGRRSSFTSGRRSTSGSGSLSPHERRLSVSRSPLLRTSPQHQRTVQSPRGRGRTRIDERLSPRVLRPSSSPMSRSPSRQSASGDRSPYKLPVGKPKEQTTRDVSSSPPRKLREQKLQYSNKESSGKEQGGDHKSKPLEKRLQNSSIIAKQKDSTSKVCDRKEYSPERFSIRGVMEAQSDQKDVALSKDQEKMREMGGIPETHLRQKSPVMYKDTLPDETKQPSYPGEGNKSEKNRSSSKNVQGSGLHHKSESLDTSIEHVHHSTHGGTSDSGSEEIDKHKAGDKEKRKHKRSKRREAVLDDDYSDDSDIEDRKEVKRRRKEEKRLRKEKRRQRREERRQRREERRAEKQKGRNQSDASASDGEYMTRMEAHSEDTVSEQKKLEIELRKKALESLKAKKGISH